jgi:uncharacterized protein (DUF2147 family)
MNKGHKIVLALLALMLIATTSLFAEKDVTGFWKTIDDETGLPKAVVAVYTYGGKLYGRVLLSYEEDGKTIKDDMYKQELRSPYLVGNPPFSGLDIIWDLEYNARKDQWSGGTILDPGNDKTDSEKKEPKTYGCVIWKEGNDLIVRGKIAFIGRNQTWKPFSRSNFPDGFRVPDYASFRPTIPSIK